MKYYIVLVGCAYVILRENEDGRLHFFTTTVSRWCGQDEALSNIENPRNWDRFVLMAYPFPSDSDAEQVLNAAGIHESETPRKIDQLCDRYLQDLDRGFDRLEDCIEDDTTATRILEL